VFAPLAVGELDAFALRERPGHRPASARRAAVIHQSDAFLSPSGLTLPGMSTPGSTDPAAEPTPPRDGAPQPRGSGPAGGPGPRRSLALSPSRASDFKQCPLLYRFRAIDRIPETPSTAQARGTLVHSALESLYALPAQERVSGTAMGMIEPA